MATPSRALNMTSSTPPYAIVDNNGAGGDANDETSGGRFVVSDSFAAPRPDGGSATGGSDGGGPDKRAYLKLANDVSFGKLESHLREYVRSIPFRQPPTYVAPGGAKPDPARPSKYNAEWDQVFERNPQQQEVLNHSASFRYCTQRLATGFHSPYESHRRPVEYKDFSRILSVPNPSNYEALDPKVADLELGEHNDDGPVPMPGPAGTGGANVQASQFLAARINAAKRKGVALRMSRSEVQKELSRLDVEDAADKELESEEALRQKRERDDARRDAEKKRREEEDKLRKGTPKVVNMYDLSDWRHATGRCLVTTMTSWKGQTSSYF